MSSPAPVESWPDSWLSPTERKGLRPLTIAPEPVPAGSVKVPHAALTGTPHSPAWYRRRTLARVATYLTISAATVAVIWLCIVAIATIPEWL